MTRDPALGRWLVINAARFVCVAVAVLGVVLLGRGTAWPQQLLGLAIVLSAMWLMLIVPKALAHRWRSPRP